jgi:hypothetical protein
MQNIHKYAFRQTVTLLPIVWTFIQEYFLLDDRLLRWSDENNIVSDAQFGFKPGFGTTGAVFSLQSVINRTLSRNKKLFCCFVDYQKAFDNVNRSKLSFKLARFGVTGKLLTLIRSLYSNLKSCVRF